MFRAHGEESRRQQEKLRERLEALKGLGLASLRKGAAAIVSAEAKGVFDVSRGDKPIQNARDAFWTEHLQIASDEILERVDERARDRETTRVGREDCAEEWVMVGRIAEAWDRFVDLVLSDRGRRT